MSPGRWLLLGIFVLCLIGYLFNGSGQPEFSPHRVGEMDLPTNAVKPSSDLIDEGLARDVLFSPVFIDAISGQVVYPMGIRLTCSKGNFEASQDSQLNKDLLGYLDARWEYSILSNDGTRSRSSPVKISLVPSRENSFELLYSWEIGVEAFDRATGSPVTNAVVCAFLVPPDAGQEPPRNELSRFVPGSFESILNWCESNPEKCPSIGLLWDPSTKQFVGTEAWQGKVLLSCWSPSFGLSFKWVEVSPGESLFVEFALAKRPELSGVVYDWNGLPVSDSTVEIAVSLNPYSPDYSSYDHSTGMGFVMAGTPENCVRALKISAVTDENGRYRSSVPAGEEISALAYWGESSGFSRATMDGVVDGNLELDVHLLNPKEVENVSISFVTEEGSRLQGAKVDLAIVDDFPFFRTFPKQFVGESLKVAFPHIELGTRVCVFVKSKELKGGMYTSEYFGLEDYSVSLVIPREAFEDE